MTEALRTERLGKRYRRGLWGLREVSLTIPAGSIAGLVGPNGAGKTTLLRLVTNLMRPSEGSVRVFGRPVIAGSGTALAEVAYVAQRHPLYRGFTVSETLRMGQRLNGQWDARLARERLGGLGISPDRKIKHLSVGQQAQVALTMALAKRSPLLVLDEPLAHLDPVARRDFTRGLTASVAEYGLTAIVSSHIIADLERVCDFLIVLDQGRVRLSGPVDDIVATHRLLTGPPVTSPAAFPGLVTAIHSDRHSSLLVRQEPGRVALHPTWQSAPVSLEEVILAYLTASGK